MKHCIFILALSFGIMPLSAQAYFTTAQQVVSLNDTTALFSITYRFGHDKYDLYLPVLARRDQRVDQEVQTAGFELLEDGFDRSYTGSVFGFVASNMPIVEGMYKVPKGLPAEFTFYGIATIDADDVAGNYSLRMTAMPFYAGDDRDFMHLNPSELQYYETPTVTLTHGS